jgi:hypothetical protein
MEIYISYARVRGDKKSKKPPKIVNDLRKACEKRGHEVKIDIENPYKQSIKGYMNELGRASNIILVISDRYLRSEYCMFEALAILESSDFRARIYPIVLDDTDIYNDNSLVKYINYWEKKKEEYLKKIDGLRDPSRADPVFEKYNQICDIRGRIADFIDKIKDMHIPDSKRLRYSDFKTIFDTIEKRKATSSGMDTTISFPHNQKIGEKPYLLLNRIPQVNEFKEYLKSSHSIKYPYFFVNHGFIGDCHSSLVERLARIASIEFNRSPYKIFRVEWPAVNKADFSTRLENSIFESLTRNSNKFVPDLTEVINSGIFAKQIVVIENNIIVERWTNKLYFALKWYFKFLDIDLGNNDLPFLIFINLIYKDTKPSKSTIIWYKKTPTALFVKKKFKKIFPQTRYTCFEQLEKINYSMVIEFFLKEEIRDILLPYREKISLDKNKEYDMFEVEGKIQGIINQIRRKYETNRSF